MSFFSPRYCNGPCCMLPRTNYMCLFVKSHQCWNFRGFPFSALLRVGSWVHAEWVFPLDPPKARRSPLGGVHSSWPWWRAICHLCCPTSFWRTLSGRFFRLGIIIFSSPLVRNSCFWNFFPCGSPAVWFCFPPLCMWCVSPCSNLGVFFPLVGTCCMPLGPYAVGDCCVT